MEIKKHLKSISFHWDGKNLRFEEAGTEYCYLFLKRSNVFSLQRFLTRIFQGERGYYNKIRKERGKK